MMNLLEAVGSILEGDGFEVERAHNGEEALEILRRRRPFLILLDLMMPVMNGWGVFALFQIQQPGLGHTDHRLFGGPFAAREWGGVYEKARRSFAVALCGPSLF
jgi:hypothetical protein